MAHVAKASATVRHARKCYRVDVPLALAAQLEALIEMHPQQKRSQVLADVLALGLAALAQAHAADSPHPPPPNPDATQAIYLLSGPFSEFRNLAYKHHLALENAANSKGVVAPEAADEYALQSSSEM